MIQLPDGAVPNGASPGYIDFGGFLVPALGGRVQRIDRMGNRFKMAFSFPPMPADGMGRVVVSRLIRGKTEGIKLEVPLLGFKPGAPGSPLVNGALQSGRSLIADGFTPYYALREGQWFNHISGTDCLLYNVDSAIMANASGQVTIPLSPMLRVQPADNDVLSFVRPMIQGYVMGEEWRWEWSLAHHAAIEFEVEEMV